MTFRPWWSFFDQSIIGLITIRHCVFYNLFILYTIKYLPTSDIIISVVPGFSRSRIMFTSPISYWNKKHFPLSRSSPPNTHNPITLYDHDDIFGGWISIHLFLPFSRYLPNVFLPMTIGIKRYFPTKRAPINNHLIT